MTELRKILISKKLHLIGSNIPCRKLYLNLLILKHENAKKATKVGKAQEFISNSKKSKSIS